LVEASVKVKVKIYLQIKFPKERLLL